MGTKAILSGHRIGGFVLLMVTCCASAPTGPASAPTDVRSILQTLHHRTGAAMEAGDTTAVAALYDAAALMVLTNGKFHRGRPAIQAVVEGAPALELRDTRFTDVSIQPLKNGAYVQARFAFAMTLPNGHVVRPTGRRLTLWQPAAQGWAIKADVWVPDRPAPDPSTSDALAHHIRALDDAYNAHDPNGARALFAPMALFGLSDASVFEGPGVDGMLSFAFGAGLRDMRIAPSRMVDMGQAVAVQSRFGLSISNDSVPTRTIEGCRLDVWTKVENRWQLLVELAQPTGSASCLPDGETAAAP